MVICLNVYIVIKLQSTIVINLCYIFWKVWTPFRKLVVVSYLNFVLNRILKLVKQYQQTPWFLIGTCSWSLGKIMNWSLRLLATKECLGLRLRELLSHIIAHNLPKLFIGYYMNHILCSSRFDHIRWLQIHRIQGNNLIPFTQN